jgi:T5orf172 domain
MYITKSLDRNTGRNLVKIDKGTDLDLKYLNKARTDAGCQLQALDLVLVDLIHVKHPERAVKLVDTELENFRAKLDCQHRQSEVTSYAGEQEHRNWFDIPENVAIESVRRWRDFVHEAYNSAGTIKDKWVQMATLLPKPSHSEIQSLERGLLTGDEKSIALHHELRNSRYKQWIRDGRSSNV